MSDPAYRTSKDYAALWRLAHHGYQTMRRDSAERMYATKLLKLVLDAVPKEVREDGD